LKEAESILLEPYYDFQLEVPEKMVGRAMMDIEKMHGTCEISQINGDMAVLVGSAPVVTMELSERGCGIYQRSWQTVFAVLKGMSRAIMRRKL